RGPLLLCAPDAVQAPGHSGHRQLLRPHLREDRAVPRPVHPVLRPPAPGHGLAGAGGVPGRVSELAGRGGPARCGRPTGNLRSTGETMATTELPLPALPEAYHEEPGGIVDYLTT